MRAKDFILELFHPEHAVPLTWNKGNGITAAYGSIIIQGEDVGIDIGFHDMGHGIVNIEFSVNGDFELSGKGGVSQVFATVIEAVREFVMKNSKVEYITFTAEEKSRARMYDTITKRVAHKLGWHVVPHEEMIADPKFKTLLSYGAFAFVIQRGGAPAHRQHAQKPQHSDFLIIYHVYSMENHSLPAIKVKAKNGNDAEAWVMKNIPGYEKEHPMAVFASKAPPEGRQIIDKGTVPSPASKPAAHQHTPLEKALRDKLGADE